MIRGMRGGRNHATGMHAKAGQWTHMKRLMYYSSTQRTQGPGPRFIALVWGTSQMNIDDMT